MEVAQAAISDRPLLLYALVLATAVGVASVTATVLSIVSHARSNLKWGTRMQMAAELLGAARSNVDLALGIAGMSRNEIEGVDPATWSIDRYSLEEAEAAFQDFLEQADRFLQSLDQMPISTFATIDDHADNVLELLDEVAALRVLIYRSQTSPP